MKKELKAFDIEIINLSNKKHNYDFEIDDIMFQNMPDSFLKHGQLKSQVSLDKSETMIQVAMKTKGFVELACDRCGEMFDFSIDIENKIIFKFGEEFQELTEDIIVIPRLLQRLNIAQYLYEFIVLAIPIKKTHPKFGEEDQDTHQEANLIYSTGGFNKIEETANEIDPRWAALANLKKGKQNKI
ncbi:MAG: DUF177 domain-containing protein [Cytophagales bacterium]|nr:MAG: DUF177 domain-containing protein [Cytophagales bacterium]